MHHKLNRAFTRLAHGLVHYRERPGEAATASQRPLLLLHASPSCGRSLEPIMLADTSQRRLIAPDTPGNGDSDPLSVASPAMADYADALAAFCAEEGLTSVDIHGSHTGAHIAVELAARHPQLVHAITVDGLLTLTAEERQDYLANYAPPKVPDAAGSQFHWVWQYVRDQMIFFPHFKKDLAHLRAGGIFDPQFLHEMALDVLRALPTYHLAYEAVFRHELREVLPRVSCPVRWLDTGEGYLDEGRDLMLSLVPGASVVEVSHDPAVFARAIDRFCKEA